MLGTASRVTVASGLLKTTTSQSGTASLGYQGYTVASGHILQKTTEGTHCREQGFVITYIHDVAMYG